jgi:hypothetical protein
MASSSTDRRERERLTVEVPADLHDSLTRWAQEEGRPVGNLMRRLLAMSVTEREQAGAGRAA